MEDVAPLGAGYWSQAWSFRLDGRDLVLRVGQHVEDFRKDALAASFSRPGLPVPTVLEVGEASGGWFAVSGRAHGGFLEEQDEATLRQVLPPLLVALATVEAPGPGYGPWGSDGTAPCPTWRDHLLSVADDPPGRRTHGWRARLAEHPAEEAVFEEGLEHLGALVDLVPEAPTGVVHADLLNRNVLVGNAVSAVFDWGCSVWGDPLYDVAQLAFWSDWHPAVARVARDLAPADREAQLRCYAVHIGLEHVGYNAFLGDWAMAGTLGRLTLEAAR